MGQSKPDGNSGHHEDGRLILGMKAACDVLRNEASKAQDAGVSIRLSTRTQALNLSAYVIERHIQKLQGDLCGCGIAPVVPGRAGCWMCETEVNS